MKPTCNLYLLSLKSHILKCYCPQYYTQALASYITAYYMKVSINKLSSFNIKSTSVIGIFGNVSLSSLGGHILISYCPQYYTRVLASNTLAYCMKASTNKLNSFNVKSTGVIYIFGKASLSSLGGHILISYCPQYYTRVLASNTLAYYMQATIDKFNNFKVQPTSAKSILGNVSLSSLEGHF